MNKLFVYLFLLLLSSCGLGTKEVVDNQIKSKIIFAKSKTINKELNPNLKLKISKLSKGEVFFRNNTNNAGNINFETNFEKTKTYKFSTIKEFDFNQPELIFTEDKGIVFFDGKGSIFKINNDLKEVWKVNHYTKREKKLKPIIYFAQTNNKLVAADNLSKVYLIDLHNGDLIKAIEVNTGFNSNIKIYNDKFLIVDLNNTIKCFSINDGNELWSFETEDPFIKSKKKLSLITKGELVFFINNIGDLTALNIANGSLFWQTPTQSNVIYQNAFTLENSDLVFANDTIYFSNNKNELFSIDARSGVVNWKQTINSSLTPTIIENLIFSVSNEGYLFVVENMKGNIIRITDILKNIKNKKNRIRPTGFVIARNKIYLSLNNGRLIKVNISTGEDESINKLSGSKILRPKVFNDNMYIVKNNAIIKTE